jgi:Putative peptidoglycan binding domain
MPLRQFADRSHMRTARTAILLIPIFMAAMLAGELSAQSPQIESGPEAAAKSDSCTSAFEGPCIRPLNEQFNLVRAVALALKSRGFEVGAPINGIYWDPLRNSVAKVQKAAGLQPTGQLDRRTVKTILGVDLQERSR